MRFVRNIDKKYSMPCFLTLICYRLRYQYNKISDSLISVRRVVNDFHIKKRNSRVPTPECG